MSEGQVEIGSATRNESGQSRTSCDESEVQTIACVTMWMAFHREEQHDR
jgi:hypothetical protein